jgi:hypothetical protein
MNSFASSCVCTIAIVALAHTAHAANVTQPQSVQVASVAGSRSATKGYFAFTTTASVAGCEDGFWLPNSDANFASTLALVNDALVTKVALTVAGDRDQTRPDSTERVCRIMQLQ